MIRLYLIIAIIIFTLLTAIIGCGAVTNFVVGASGNLFSDSVDRVINAKLNPSDCKGKE